MVKGSHNSSDTLTNKMMVHVIAISDLKGCVIFNFLSAYKDDSSQTGKNASQLELDKNQSELLYFIF